MEALKVAGGWTNPRARLKQTGDMVPLGTLAQEIALGGKEPNSSYTRVIATSGSLPRAQREQ